MTKNYTIKDISEGLAKKEFSAEEILSHYSNKIGLENKKLNAYLSTLDFQNSKFKIQNSSLAGVPAAIKDNMLIDGTVATAGSKILENYTSAYDATVIDKLKKAGVQFLGKTNMDEFAMGSSVENSAFGPTKNPHDLERVPGGSSGGSAAAVAADLCVFALGSDTGGSIRQPASLCGVVGLKPTYGRVSRHGLIAVTSSFEQIGPITKNVYDAALVLEWISGEDKMDGNCYGKKFVRTPLRWTHNIRIGVPREYFGEGLDPKVKKVIQDAIKKLEELGAEIKEVSLPHSEYALAAYYIINTSEISSNLARLDGIRYGKSRDNFGEEVKRRIMLWTYALSSGYYDEYYVKAAKVRTLIKQDFEKAFEKCDVIVGPVSPTVAWNIGEKINDPLTMYLSDIYTISANLAGIPALSIPCGFVDRLPVGLQVLGKAWDEETILKVGFAYEQVTDWRKDKPKL